MRRMRLLATMVAVHALTAVAPAAAGGSHLSPVRDRYERGEVATLVGYTSGGQLGWVQDGPFFAYLVAGDVTLWSDRRLPPEHVALGPLSIQARGRTLRVGISFVVPERLAAGFYTVTYCNDPCTTGLGDLIGGSLAVGIDPPTAVQREWFLDDPEIAKLADDAILSGPAGRATAGEVRAGPAANLPGETRDDRWLGTLLVLTTALIAVGAVMRLRPGSRQRVVSGRRSGPGRRSSGPRAGTVSG